MNEDALDQLLNESQITPTQGPEILEEEPEKAPRLVGVTTVLRENGMVDDRWFTEAARFRGSMVHQLCEYYLQNDLLMRSVDLRLRGYLHGLRKFVKETGYVAEACESRVRHDDLGYIGKLDSRGYCTRGKAIIDFKTGAIAPATRYQLVAYTGCLPTPQLYWRLAVQLTPDGDYHLQVYQPKDFLRDWARWNSLVDVFHLKRELKLLKGKPK